MKHFVKKYVCKAVLAGLVISLLPVSVYGGQRPIVQKSTGKPRPLARKKIDWYLQQIKNTSHVFDNFANAIKKGSSKLKKAIDEVLAKVSGKSGEISQESKKVLESAAIAGTATAVGLRGSAEVVVAASIATTVGVAKIGKQLIINQIKAGATAQAVRELNLKAQRAFKEVKYLEKLISGAIKEIRRQIEKGVTPMTKGTLDISGHTPFHYFMRKASGTTWTKVWKKVGITPNKEIEIIWKHSKNLERKQIIFENLSGRLSEAVDSLKKQISAAEFQFSIPSLPILLGISLGVHFMLLPAYLISLGLTSAVFSGILAVVYGGAIGVSSLYVKRLEKEEQRYPGTLTDADLTTIKIFKNVSKGPIVRALLQGKRIKDVRYKIAQSVVQENKAFISKAASEKRAIKDIQNYMLAKMRIPGLGKVLYPMNLNITWHNYLKYMDIKVTWKVINEYNRMKKDLNQDERNQLMKEQIEHMKGLYDKMSKTKRFLKRLTPGFHVLNVKEFALKIKPSYALNQNALNSDMKTVKKLDAKYGSSFANKVQPAIEKYQQEMQKIIEELSVEVAEVGEI